VGSDPETREVVVARCPAIKRDHEGVVRSAACLALVAALAWFTACISDTSGPCTTCPPPPNGPIVSNPMLPSASGRAAASRLPNRPSLSMAGTDSTVFVSLPPGTQPDGGLATIRNTRTGAEVPAAMASGGFDPVPVSASVGDTLSIDIALIGGGQVSFKIAVPDTRPPIVVRTDPPPRKRDVPLNASVQVILSEPIDPRTIVGVRLLRGGAQVASHATLSGDGLRVTLQPDQSLAPSTDYTLSVSTVVKDLSGEPLDRAVQVAFTTGTSAEVAWISTEQAVVFTNPFNGQLRTFNATAIRYADGRVTGYYDIFYPGTGSLTAGLVTCFAIVNGTEAWAAGPLEMDPDSLGRVYDFGWRAVDHGPPGNGVPDQLSLAFPLDTNALGTAQNFCATRPTSGARDGEIIPYDVVSGNIVIATGDGTHPPPPPPPPPPPADGISQIAFASGAYPGAPSGGIKVMNADGSSVRTLTSAGGDWNPAWSPGGGMLAFESDRGHPSNGDIYVMYYDGTGVRQLTSDASNDRQPAWSHDGRRIAFYRDGGIYVMNAADGSDLTRVTEGAHPAWSPDGTRIAFAGPNGHIWVANADGSGLAQLTSAVGFDDTPAWSPDGLRLAYQHTPPQSSAGAIYLMNADGSGTTQLTLAGQTPAWSPDGTMIVFEYFGLNIIGVDGSGLTRLGTGFAPAWSPVGMMPPRPQANRSMTIAGGNGQSDTVLATLPEPLSVLVQDDQGIPVPGVVINFIVSAGQGASIPTHWTRTDSAGIASVILTLGPQPGVDTVRAFGTDGTINTAGVVFIATATAGSPVGITGSPASPFPVSVDSTATLSVMAFDAHGSPGNPVSGVPITWTLSQGGGSLTPLQDSTGSGTSGPVSASARYSAGAFEGSAAITATAPTLPGAPQVIWTAKVVSATIAVGGPVPRSRGKICLQAFRPASVTILAGATVAWTWLGCTGHNVVFEDNPAQPISSVTQSTGIHFRTFTIPATYRYRCTLHSTDFATGEVGTVTVAGQP